MEKKISPIAQSLKNKREIHYNLLKEKHDAFLKNDWKLTDELEIKINLISDLIQADQKLLEVEREELIDAFNSGAESVTADYKCPETGEDYYNETYQTDV